MTMRKTVLGSVAILTMAGSARAADLALTKVEPVTYVRICSTYGAGFFAIPGTDTCLRVSGRARGEVGAQTNENRSVGSQVGDVSMFRSFLRINMDARTQTDFGTLRAFIRVETSSRTGAYATSGTQQRAGNGFPALGIDQFSRVQQTVNTEKAFIQFAGLTAGRASSFFDFYAHDFEIIGASAGSDLASTNLLAYTATLGSGFSATLSLEDPNLRHNNVYNASVTAAGAAAGTSSANVFFLTTAPTPLILATNAAGNATAVTFQDVIERSRLPNFVGVARYDGAFGSAQISAAVKDVNIGGTQGGGFLPAAPANAAALLASRGLRGGATTDYGYAIQGGVKLNMAFLSPGDTLYLQGAYGVGANNYVGICSYLGCYQNASTPTNGGPFTRYLSDAVLNPLTGKLQLTESFSLVASFLHYWSPELRSAFFASYDQVTFGRGARADLSLTQNLVGAAAGSASIVTSPLLYSLSPVLRDNHEVYAGASIIWSPVKDLDIGLEGVYLNTAMAKGRVIDQTKTTGVTAANINVLAAANAIKTLNNYDAAQMRFRVQRDF